MRKYKKRSEEMIEISTKSKKNISTKKDLAECDFTLSDRELKADEVEIIYKFIQSGDMIGSYNSVRKKPSGMWSYDRVYHFFNSKVVRDKIIEIGNTLSVYDTVCDVTLISIITNKSETSKNKILAIKEWNALRQRTFTTIQLNDIKNFDFNNINDDNINRLLNILNEDKSDAKIQQIIIKDDEE